jgi:glycosyltransferase involved in cell wall biosynthesis
MERGFILSPFVSDIANLYYTVSIESGGLEKAEELFRTARDLNPANKMIVFLLIDLLIRQGKNVQAMEEIENALLLFGVDDGILNAALSAREKIGDSSRGATSEKAADESITLCMIVKDEEKNIVRCLMSVKPVVDEMIVVDTGSTDRTKEIATALGAKVYDFPWNDDFSAARNFSLSNATGKWILVLDADEVISPRDYGVLRQLVQEKGKAFSIVTRNYVNNINKTTWTANMGDYPDVEEGLGWMPSDKVRLFPNDRRIVFVNPVHEIVEPSIEKIGMKIRPCPVVVHHYGKLDSDKTLSKGENYYLLGLKKLEENGDDVKALKELAIQAGELKHFSEAIDLWQRTLKLYPNMVEAYVNMTSIYAQMGLYRESLAAGEKAIELNPDSKDAVCNYALSEIYGGDVKKSVDVLEKLLKKERNFPQANIMLGVAYLCLGNSEKGISVFSDLGIVGDALAATVKSFADALAGAGRNDYAAALLASIGE